MADYKITDEVANAVLQYLSTKPFNEVQELIAKMSKITPIEDEKEEKE